MTNKIPKKLMKEFDEFFEINKLFLQKNKSFTPAVQIITEKDEKLMIMIPFRNKEEKQIAKNLIKLAVLKTDSKAYIFVSDTKMTKVNNENFDKSEVFDALVQILFTPDGSFQKIFVHNGKGKEIQFDEIKEDDSYQEIESDWNLWNNPVGFDDINLENYRKFKKDNPELFKDVGDKK